VKSILTCADIFKYINREDWVFSTYRNHYHALLHGVDPEWLFEQIKAGKSMNITCSKPRFFTSAIVSGILPIAVGVARAINDSRRVWCFVGDMAATTGAFHEAQKYASGHDLPITFIVEDNGLSCDSPTAETWGSGRANKLISYTYKRQHRHVGTGKFVHF